MSDVFGTSFHIGQLLRIVRRRWRMVVACALLTGLGALAIGVLLPPHYTAKAQLVLELSPGDPSSRTEELTVQTWVELMSSDDHIRRLQESLERDPPAIASAEYERPVLTILMDRALTAISTMFGAPGPDENAGSAAPGQARFPGLRELDNRLRVFKERQSRILSVTFTSSDPGIAAAVANRSASLFLEDRLRRQEEERRQALEVLRRRIAEARGDMNRTAGTLSEYRVHHGSADPDRSEQVDTQITETARQLVMATADLASARQADGLRRRASLAGPMPPAWRGNIATQSGTPSDVETRPVDSDIAVLEARIRYLTDRLAALQEASGAARAADLRLRDLHLESRTATSAYETLLSQALALDSGPIRPQASVVSVAMPPLQPSSLDPIFFVPPALVAGTIGGGLLAVLLQRLDRRARTERSVEAALGVPCISVVPKARRMDSLHPVRALLHDPFAPYTKAIRATAMALLGLPGIKLLGKVILFTSSQRGEGKTALAVSFASYAALLHRKVLVIDLDLPSPGLGGLLGADDGPGGLDVLRGVPLADAVRTNEELGIDYLPLSQEQNDPLLLMAEDKVFALIEDMRRGYDCVVIDGAAVLGNPEMRVLAAIADQVVLTLKWGSTNLDLAQSAMDELLRARRASAERASVCSILTQVEPRLYPTYATWPDDGRHDQRRGTAADRGADG